ncbi:TIGR03084 family metal-binding protein [Nocardioides sp. R-C-SC26]|uniref:TIGR03084 family metal-binding protein n=1 Tax=Nocardioides sp. R-C-SC26 TaxID=2870414 RepID=UPI001E579B27|nr:TIGR03084 family metal-binding protein [Nocardioides sp. R-C-SC26]
MPTVLDELLADLTDESDRLRAVVAGLPDDGEGWRLATPAAGWDVAAQIAHLMWTDEVAALAAHAHADQAPWDAIVLTAMADPTGFVDTCALELAALDAATLLQRWDAARPALGEALRQVPEGQKMPWFGPPMSPTSMATARFMETWAHALDVYEALGVDAEHTDRIKHVAHIGVRTRGFSFVTNGLDVPDVEPRIELTAPSGAVWSWGPDDAAERVDGSAVDFCLLVTQRVHRADTDLVATGPGADAWLDIAQCFAGPPGAGREPGRDGGAEGGR